MSATPHNGNSEQLPVGDRASFAPNPVSSLWTGGTRLETHVVASASFPLTLDSEGVQTDAPVLLMTPRRISTATRPPGLWTLAAMRLTKGWTGGLVAVIQPADALPRERTAGFLTVGSQTPNAALRAAFAHTELAEFETRTSRGIRDPALKNPAALLINVQLFASALYSRCPMFRKGELQ